MIWNILIKTMKMHMSQGEMSGGNNLSERPAEISIPSFLAGPHPPGKSHTHVTFFRVTSCMCCVLEARFSGQMRQRAHSLSPLRIRCAAAPSRWAFWSSLPWTVLFFFLVFTSIRRKERPPAFGPFLYIVWVTGPLYSL